MLGLQVHTALASLPCPLQQGVVFLRPCVYEAEDDLEAWSSFFHLEGVRAQVWSPAKLWGMALENWESAPDFVSAPHRILLLEISGAKNSAAYPGVRTPVPGPAPTPWQCFFLTPPPFSFLGPFETVLLCNPGWPSIPGNADRHFCLSLLGTENISHTHPFW